MSDLIPYPVRRKRRRPILKNLVAMVCVMAMMLGSGYVGARIAVHSLHSDTEISQVQHPAGSTRIRTLISYRAEQRELS